MGKNKATQKTTQKTKTAPSVVVDNTKLKLTLAWKEIKQAYDRVLKNSAKNIKAQGFRQGKVPLKIAEEKIGRDHLINKVLEVIVPQKYQDLIKKEKKEPLTPPEIKPLKMDWEQDFELEIYIAEKPIIKLGNYRQAVKKGLKAAIKQFKEHTKEPKDG
ncbi:trigger factor family protein, partial [Patescibacteria group bacterium]|nr:trigger factor family protein [Patescibacteria group bacterium]MBU1967097.1 trigger factor family protein [Patescibacteria group bacterium]